jgi:class 3 adenylate cyclase/streptogramin lyase
MQRRSGGRGLGAVLFTDIVGSTAIAAEMGNTRWVELVARHHRIVRRSISRFGGQEIDTAGDGFFVAFERPADAIRCGVDATEAVRELGIEIRAGIAFGELEVADRKPGGLVVNTAARVMSVAGPGEVLVPASVRDLVPGSGITFADHGVHRLKGFEDEVHLFDVTGVDGREVAPPLPVEEAVERRREIFPSAARRRSALLIGAAAGLVAVVVAAALLLRHGSTELPSSGPLRDAVARIEAAGEGRIGSIVPLGTLSRLAMGVGFVRHPLVAGEGGVWLLRPPSLVHIDPRHGDIRSATINVGIATSQWVATGFDAVWVDSAETLYRVNPATDQQEVFFRLPAATGIATYSFALARDLWIGTSDGTIVRIDPRTGEHRQAHTDLAIDAMAAAGGRIWASDILAGDVVSIDPVTLRPVDRVDVHGSLDQLAGDEDTVWVLDRSVGVVTRIDAASAIVTGSARVGVHSTDLAVGAGAVWVGDRDGSVFRLDPSTLEVREFPVDAQVLGVAVDDVTGSVWVYVGAPA